MGCYFVRRLIQAYLGGALREGDAGRLRRHCSRCASCAAALREAEETARLVASLPRLSLPATETGALLAQVRARGQERLGSQLLGTVPGPVAARKAAGERASEEWDALKHALALLGFRVFTGWGALPAYAAAPVAAALLLLFYRGMPTPSETARAPQGAALPSPQGPRQEPSHRFEATDREGNPLAGAPPAAVATPPAAVAARGAQQGGGDASSNSRATNRDASRASGTPAFRKEVALLPARPAVGAGAIAGPTENAPGAAGSGGQRKDATSFGMPAPSLGSAVPDTKQASGERLGGGFAGSTREVDTLRAPAEAPTSLTAGAHAPGPEGAGAAAQSRARSELRAATALRPEAEATAGARAVPVAPPRPTVVRSARGAAIRPDGEATSRQPGPAAGPEAVPPLTQAVRGANAVVTGPPAAAPAAPATGAAPLAAPPTVAMRATPSPASGTGRLSGPGAADTAGSPAEKAANPTTGAAKARPEADLPLEALLHRLRGKPEEARAAARELGLRGGKGAIEGLTKALREGPDAATRAAAADALAAIATPEAIVALRVVAATEGPAREPARRALARLKRNP